MSTRLLQQLVDNPDRGSGRAFAWFIQIVIIISILDFTIETIPSLSPQLRETLWIVEIVSIAIFTVEFLLRLFRRFKLARYSTAMRRYHIAFRSGREELLLFGASALSQAREEMKKKTESQPN